MDFNNSFFKYNTIARTLHYIENVTNMMYDLYDLNVTC